MFIDLFGCILGLLKVKLNKIVWYMIGILVIVILKLIFLFFKYFIILLEVFKLNVLLLDNIIVLILLIIFIGLSKLVFWVLGELLCIFMLLVVFCLYIIIE